LKNTTSNSGTTFGDDFGDIFQGLGLVLVKSLADFPTPVAGVITLVASTVYHIGGIVDIGSNRIVLAATNSIVGTSRLNDRLLAAVIIPLLFTV